MTLQEALDAIRELIHEAAHYAGPEEFDNQGIWDAITEAEKAVKRLDRALLED